MRRTPAPNNDPLGWCVPFPQLYWQKPVTIFPVLSNLTELATSMVAEIISFAVSFSVKKK